MKKKGQYYLIHRMLSDFLSYWPASEMSQTNKKHAWTKEAVSIEKGVKSRLKHRQAALELLIHFPYQNDVAASFLCFSCISTTKWGDAEMPHVPSDKLCAFGSNWNGEKAEILLAFTDRSGLY